MKHKNKLIFSSFFLLIVGFLNYYSRKHLDYGYAELLSYNDLYYPSEQLHISDIKWDQKDSLTFIFGGDGISDNNVFKVDTNNHFFVRKKASSLGMRIFPLLKGYTIAINSGDDTAKIDIEYAPPSIYSSHGNSSRGSVEIYNSSLIIGSHDQHNLDEWRWDTADRNNAILRSCIKDSINIRDGDSSEEKVRKIAAYVLNVTQGDYGIPSDSVLQLDPIQKLNAARKKVSKIWCGDYAGIFSLFAANAGLIVRIVGCGATMGNVIYSPHTFNEVYLRELNRWAYVDFTDKNIFVKRKGQFLSSVDIYRLQRYNAADPELIASYYDGHEFVDTSFYKTAFFGRQALNYNNTMTFYYGSYRETPNNSTFWNHVKNLFSTKPHYAVYSDNVSGVQIQFYLRIISNYLLLMTFLCWSFFASIFLSVTFRKLTIKLPRRSSASKSI